MSKRKRIEQLELMLLRKDQENKKLKKQVKKKEKDEWVDINDRLPSESGLYLTMLHFDLTDVDLMVLQKYSTEVGFDKDQLSTRVKTYAWRVVEPYERKE